MQQLFLDSAKIYHSLNQNTTYLALKNLWFDRIMVNDLKFLLRKYPIISIIWLFPNFLNGFHNYIQYLTIEILSKQLKLNRNNHSHCLKVSPFLL